MASASASPTQPDLLEEEDEYTLDLVREATALLDARDAREESSSRARVSDRRVAESRPSAQLLHAPSATPKEDLPQPMRIGRHELDSMRFTSWYWETPTKKRFLSIRYAIGPEEFEVTLLHREPGAVPALNEANEADQSKTFRIKTLKAKHGPASVWDLHIKATLDIFGRPTSLLQCEYEDGDAWSRTVRTPLFVRLLSATDTLPWRCFCCFLLSSLLSSAPPLARGSRRTRVASSKCARCSRPRWPSTRRSQRRGKQIYRSSGNEPRA